MNSRCQSLSVAAGSLLSIVTCGDFVVLEEATTGGWRIQWNTYSQLWKEATFLSKKMNNCDWLNSFTQQIGWLCCSLVCVPWLYLGGYACWTWFLYPLSIGRWEVLAGKGMFIFHFCAMVKSSKCPLVAERDRRKKVSFPAITLFSSLITLRAAMTDCTDWIKPWNHRGTKTRVWEKFNYFIIFKVALCNFIIVYSSLTLRCLLCSLSV